MKDGQLQGCGMKTYYAPSVGEKQFYASDVPVLLKSDVEAAVERTIDHITAYIFNAWNSDTVPGTTRAVRDIIRKEMGLT